MEVGEADLGPTRLLDISQHSGRSHVNLVNFLLKFHNIWSLGRGETSHLPLCCFAHWRLFVLDPFGSMDMDCGIYWSSEITRFTGSSEFITFAGPVNSLDSLVSPKKNCLEAVLAFSRLF